MTDYPKDKLFRIYAGDVGSDAYKHQYVEWLQQRLAAAEARIEWFEKSGGVAVHTIVFQRQMEIESLQAKLAAAEARVKELEQRGILNIDEVVNQFYEGS
jgi:exonuclease VII small subunit